MRAMLSVLFTISLLAAGQALAAAQHTNGLTGYWQTPSKKHAAVVYISQKNGTYSGKIVALQHPRFPKNANNGHAGEKKTDIHNPNKSKRSRPLIGLVIIKGLKPDGADHWDNGTIYNPESGKRYKLQATLQNGGKTLKIHAYVGMAMFGLTEHWKRVQGPGVFHNGSAIQP